MSSYTGSVTIGKEAYNVDISPQLQPYTMVRVIAGYDDEGNQLVYTSPGDENGRVLEVENPFGTQDMANSIYATVRGYAYQPMYADGAMLNPAADLGDGMSVNDVYSIMYSRTTDFGTLMASDIAAPTSEEVVHEFNIPTPTDRKFERLQAETQSTFIIQANKIDAKVSKQSPTGQSEFGWNLQDNQWAVYNEDGNILKATASGLEVRGKIQADEGYIGGDNGFVIKASAIYNGIETFGDTEVTNGVYIGTDGIQLGKGFSVDSSGFVKASNLKITGGMIQLGEKPDLIPPIYQDGFEYHNWEAAEDAKNTPYIVIPSQIGFKRINNTVSGYVDPGTDYEFFNNTLTFTQSYIQQLGVGNHNFTITTFEEPTRDLPAPIEQSLPYGGEATFYNWKCWQNTTSDLPYFTYPYQETGEYRFNGYWIYKATLHYITYDSNWQVTNDTEYNNFNSYTIKTEYGSSAFYLDEYFTRNPFYEPTTDEGGIHTRYRIDFIGSYWDGYSEEGASDFNFSTPDFQLLEFEPTYTTVSTPTMVITEPRGQVGYFQVDSTGAVTATNLTITGGSININDKFIVDENGNLTANTGTFLGSVHASNIQFGGEAGYFDGAGLEPFSVSGGWGGAIGGATIDTSNVVAAINSSLANGESAYFNVTSSSGGIYTGSVNTNSANIYNNFVFQGSYVHWVTFIDRNGQQHRVLGYY